jgi:RNA polymerase sigma factor (sigma-70 family)
MRKERLTMAQEIKTDEALLAAFLENADNAAFAEIAQRHGPMVYRVCYRVLADHHEAEDAAQATFAVLMKKAGSIRKHRSLGGWLHGVARMTALHLLRGRIHRREREERVAMNCANASHLTTEQSNDHCRERTLGLLDEALERLSPRQREAVALRHLQGRPIAEAAVLAGCSAAVLTSRTRDGLDKLRKFFVKRGLAVSGGFLASLFESEAQAAVPQTLLPSVVAASQSVAAGAATGTALSGSVASLAEGVITAMKTMMIKQTIGLTACMIVVSGAAVTGAVAIRQDTAAPEPSGTGSQAVSFPAEAPSDGAAPLTMSAKEGNKRTALEAKMSKIMLPEIDFRQAEFRDVVEMLRGANVEYDTADETGGGKGVNLILNVRDADALPRITFSAKHISLLEAIKIVTQMAGLTYRIADQAVIIEAKGPIAGPGGRPAAPFGQDPFGP